MDQVKITQPVISSIEQFDNIPHKSGHYRPEWYLSKYKFTKEVLLDVFCTDYNHWCYEDYYYDDICLDMIAQYQPDIDIEDFKVSWTQLDIILEAEFMSRLVVELYKENKPISTISDYKYDMISSYFAQIKKCANDNVLTQLAKDYAQMLVTNKYIGKLNLPVESNQISTRDELIQVAQFVISTVPETYSSLLPLC